MKITDAAVQAAEEAVYTRHERGFLMKPLVEPVDMRKALTAALPHLPLGYECSTSLSAMARQMLSHWEQWFSGEHNSEDDRVKANTLLKAACFAAEAYNGSAANPMTFDRAPADLLKAFLTALIDMNSPELDQYRICNRKEHGTLTNEGTKAVDVHATSFEAYMHIVELFDKDGTAGSFLNEDGEGGFLGAIDRMAREIDRLRTNTVDVAAVTRPVANIESRTPKEVFDIMCDRILALSAEPALKGQQHDK